jgi:hypothetical protein
MDWLAEIFDNWRASMCNVNPKVRNLKRFDMHEMKDVIHDLGRLLKTCVSVWLNCADIWTSATSCMGRNFLWAFNQEVIRETFLRDRS